MSDELVQRLRAVERSVRFDEFDTNNCVIIEEAIAEIERLRAEVARLTGCLVAAVPVALPERRTIPDRDDLRHTEFAHGYTAGWNACLGAIHGDIPPAARDEK